MTKIWDWIKFYISKDDAALMRKGKNPTAMVLIVNSFFCGISLALIVSNIARQEILWAVFWLIHFYLYLRATVRNYRRFGE